jgi:hypothetical protein
MFCVFFEEIFTIKETGCLFDNIKIASFASLLVKAGPIAHSVRATDS